MVVYLKTEILRKKKSTQNEKCKLQNCKFLHADYTNMVNSISSELTKN